MTKPPFRRWYILNIYFYHIVNTMIELEINNEYRKES